MGRPHCGLQHPTLAFGRLGLHLSVSDEHLSFRRDQLGKWGQDLPKQPNGKPGLGLLLLKDLKTYC